MLDFSIPDDPIRSHDARDEAPIHMIPIVAELGAKFHLLTAGQPAAVAGLAAELHPAT